MNQHGPARWCTHQAPPHALVGLRRRCWWLGGRPRRPLAESDTTPESSAEADAITLTPLVLDLTPLARERRARSSCPSSCAARDRCDQPRPQRRTPLRSRRLPATVEPPDEPLTVRTTPPAVIIPAIGDVTSGPEQLATPPVENVLPHSAGRAGSEVSSGRSCCAAPDAGPALAAPAAPAPDAGPALAAPAAPAPDAATAPSITDPLPEIQEATPVVEPGGHCFLRSRFRSPAPAQPHRSSSIRPPSLRHRLRQPQRRNEATRLQARRHARRARRPRRRRSGLRPGRTCSPESGTTPPSLRRGGRNGQRRRVRRTAGDRRRADRRIRRPHSDPVRVAAPRGVGPVAGARTRERTSSTMQRWPSKSPDGRTRSTRPSTARCTTTSVSPVPNSTHSSCRRWQRHHSTSSSDGRSNSPSGLSTLLQRRRQRCFVRARAVQRVVDASRVRCRRCRARQQTWHCRPVIGYRCWRRTSSPSSSSVLTATDATKPARRPRNRRAGDPRWRRPVDRNGSRRCSTATSSSLLPLPRIVPSGISCSPGISTPEPPTTPVKQWSRTR